MAKELNENLPNLWTCSMKTKEKIKGSAIRYCLEKGYVGVGYAVDKSGRKYPKTKKEALRLCEKREDWKENKRSWWYTPVNNVLNELAINDFVWTRTSNGIFYLGKIEGDWEYLNSPLSFELDIHHVRKCKWIELGRIVAGSITRQFSTYGKALAQIKSEKPFSTVYSTIVWNEKNKKDKLYIDNALLAKEIKASSIFNFLPPSELEDIIGLYLQFKKRYAIIPSTLHGKSTTPMIEFIMVHRKTGDRAAVQVKSGDSKHNVAKYPKENFSKIFFMGKTKGDIPDYMTKLSEKRITQFIEEKREWLPENVKVYLDLYNRYKPSN